MGQEPNIDIEFDDRPREELQPGPPARWQPDRPGDLTSPQQVPWGGAFGTPGPDTGYALKLAAGAELDLDHGENRGHVEAAMVLLMGSRASHFGRAPTNEDLQFAILVLGLAGPEQVPAAANIDLKKDRRYWAPRAANSTPVARRLVSQIPPALLDAQLEDVRHQLALGERPLAR